MKEPHGLVRDDGKRPDGLTLLPWNSGRSATWDVTVVDTLLGNAYLQQSAITSASAAETAAARKDGEIQRARRDPRVLSSGLRSVIHLRKMTLTFDLRP